MSSFSRHAALVLIAVIALAGCSLTPVYQSTSGLDPAVTNRVAFADPETRAEQIVYQALAFSLGEGDGATLLLTLSTGSEVSRVSRVASDDPAEPYQLEITGRYTLVDTADPTTPPFSETRRASATFTRGPQASANAAAETDAEERAARRLADIIRARLLIYLAS